MSTRPTHSVHISSLASEPRLSLVDLARREGVHLSTCWRWCLRGCKGHRLESFSVGGKKFTTIPAYERWLNAINGLPLVSVSTPRKRELAIQRAERRAEELGL